MTLQHRCRWDDKPIVYWNERWSHIRAQDQKECSNPFPFNEEKGPTLDSRKPNKQVDPSVCADKSIAQFGHFCPEWDMMEIDETWPEFAVCLCFEMRRLK